MEDSHTRVIGRIGGEAVLACVHEAHTRLALDATRGNMGDRRAVLALFEAFCREGRGRHASATCE